MSEDETPKRPRVVVVEVNAKRERTRPTNTEIIEHAANAMDAASGVAITVGAEGAAEVLHKSASAARSIPKAVEGVKRELQPVKDSVGGLWDAMERRGWVGRKEPVNLAAMQHRERTRNPQHASQSRKKDAS